MNRLFPVDVFVLVKKMLKEPQYAKMTLDQVVDIACRAMLEKKK